MNYRTTFFAISTALLRFDSANAEVISAFQLKHCYDRQIGRESAADINVKRVDAADAGSLVYVYYKNNSSASVSIKDITADGVGFAEMNSEEHAWEWVWLTARPESIAPGRIGEIAFSSRKTIPQDRTLELLVSGNPPEKFTVKRQPDVRFATISFSQDRRRAYCFVVPEGNAAPRLKDLKCTERATFSWRNPYFENGVRIGIFEFGKPVEPGRRLFFFAADDAGRVAAGASLRAFSNLAVSGTYGYGQMARYAANGLGGFNSFSAVPKSQLDEAAKCGVKVVTGKPDVDPTTAGHSALYAYLLQDEPDCHDYNRADRPHHARIGAMAGEMIARYNKVAAADAVKPALLTLDLTYTPSNYFVYAPLPDIANPVILYHGTDVLAENWRMVGNVSRKMRRVADLLLPAHPLEWARSDSRNVWIKTLISTDDAVLVIAVTENYSYGERKFTIRPENATITLAPNSWFKPAQVYKVDPSGFTRIPVQTGSAGGIQWNDSVFTGEIYLISSSESRAQALIAAAEAREHAANAAVDGDEREKHKK